MISIDLNRYALLAAFAFSALCLQATDKRPSGLMTDLIEHTERTWQNGYASSLPVWQLDEAIEPLQYAAIRSTHPAFSWIVPGETEGTRQTSYRLIVADNHADALAGKGNLWDSGPVESDRSVAIRYEGEALQPGQSYFWRVKTVTNTEGESEWSEVKVFRTAETLSDYETTHYPQVKTMELPTTMKTIGSDTQVVDFGKDAFGQLVLTLSSETGEDSVQVHIGECQDGNSRLLRHPGKSSIRYQCYPLALMKGTHTYRIKIRKDKRNTGQAAILMPDYVGEVLPFRYCEVEGYAGTLWAVREVVHYPFNETASSFRSSDEVLNQVWELCRYSIRATSFTGVYVDGDRERIPYEADALINQLCHYGVDREYTMARRSYEYLLQHPTWPTEWILQALSIAWNDYLYTGDSRSLAACYGQLKPRVLMALREKNGLISTTTGLQTEEFQRSIRFKGEIRDIVDWPHTGILGLGEKQGGEDDGFAFTDYNGVTNAWHYAALKQMARIAATLGNPEATFYASEAEAFRKRYVRSFFDPRKGYFRDGLVADTDHASLHGNMFPLLFGLTPEGKRQRVVDFIQTRGMACSVYGSQFLLDALYEANAADYALSLLTKTDDRGWYNMIRVGSTISLEAWDNKYKPNQDWNHAWGAAPANIIPRRLMGVEPLTPGFGTARIKPQLASLTWAEATIPTIRGAIRMKVENKADVYTLQVTIPANMDAEIYLPLPSGQYTVTKNGVPVKAARVKGEPFLSMGKVGSGSYTFVVR